MRHLNDRGPNFRDESGQLFLVRCFSCGGERGRENWAMAVASGTCAFCGWSEEPSTPDASSRKRTDDNLQSVFG